MDPSHPTPRILTHEDIFRIHLYDYFRKRGFNQTAEAFRREGEVTKQPSADHDVPQGMLRDFWGLFHDIYFSNQLPLPASSNQAPDLIGSIMNIPRMVRDGYSMHFLAGFPSHDRLVSCQFSSDGSILASGGLGKKVFICYTNTCDSVTTLESHLDPISEVCFQPGSALLATASYDKTVKLWDATKPGRLLYNLIGHNGWVKSLDFHPMEREVLCSSDSFDVIEMWNVNQGVRIKNVMAGGQIIRFQPRFGRFLAVANGKIINIFDVQIWRIQGRLEGHVNDVLAMCWDSTGQMIASVSEDCARVWSVVVCGYCMHQLPSNGKRFQSIVFHPRYPNVLVIGGFQCMEVWIPETGDIYSIHAHNGSVSGLAASTQTQCIASVSSDECVKIWK